MKKLYLQFTLAVIAMSLVACEPDARHSQDDTAKELVREQIESALKEYLKEPSRSFDEVKKLHQFEYNVFTLPLDGSSARYEGALDQMGKKRWDCFHVEKISDKKNKEKLLFFCKRHPETLLRYVPKTLLGR